MNSPSGKLIVISGPSGSGKTTILTRLLQCDPKLQLSISATTRAPRTGESDGKSYRFLSAEEFQRRREANDFLECAEVYPGLWYGTLACEVTPALAQGKWVVLEIDVQGTQSIVERFPEAITIFVRPDSLDDCQSLRELERRLRDRGTETEDAIQQRLAVARREMSQGPRYRHQVVNQNVDDAVRQIQYILSQYKE